MNRILELIIISIRPILLVVYLLARFSPRKRNVWVFGSNGGKNFSGNPKYLFLYCSQQRSRDIRAVWISRNSNVVTELKSHGYEAHLLYTWRGIYACLIAGIWLFDHSTDDITYYLSGGVITINLWHGMPLKKVGWDDHFSKWLYATGWRKPAYRLVLPWFFESYDLMLIPCVAGVDILESAFKQPRENIYVASYPRTVLFVHEMPDVLIGCPGSTYGHLSRLHLEGTRILTYMPTFRDRSDERFFDIVNMKELDEFLGKHRLCLAIKAHPRSYLTQNLDNGCFSNIIVIPSAADPYPYLAITDVLITDYSSIYFDYLMANRPIIFFCYDFEEYTSQNRQLYFEYMQVTPGPKIFNTMQLFDEILKSFDTTYYEADRRALLSWMQFYESNDIFIENITDHIVKLALNK